MANSLRRLAQRENMGTALPTPVEELIAGSTLVKQGAEGRAYRCELLPSPLMTLSSSSASEPPSSCPLGEATPAPVLLKHRFPKRYRHPTLDAQLTRQRLVSEARSLVRCLKAGVRVPALRLVDIRQGCLGMEWIDGWTVREILGGGQDDEGVAVESEDSAAPATGARPSDLDEDGMLAAIGREIAKMHLADIIHGDLTTSNLMLRRQGSPDSPPELVIIDFGLSSSSPMHEDRAVDLYVLERAFASTHPVLPGTEPHFERVLVGYRETLQASRRGEWERVEKRLEEVRLRGRKRSMVG